MRLAFLVALACAACLALAGTASADTTFTVSKIDDTADGVCDADCSLREALAAADAAPGEDTVNVKAGHYSLTLGELALNSEDTIHIVGAGARSTIVDAGGQFRVLNVKDGTVFLEGMTITGGKALGQGGGIFFDGFDLRLNHVAVVGNTATADTQGGFGGQGGGIFGDEQVTILNSLVANNVADGTGAIFSGGQGGGIFGNEPLTLQNVTVSNNTATPGDPAAVFPHSQGGGIFVNEQDTTFTHVTITGNKSTDTDSSGGVFLNDDVTFANSIVAGNTASGGPGDCDANGNTINEQGHNLMGTPVDCHFTAPGDITADPLLGPLADNGGQTDTQALLPGSPAIDKADIAQCPATDQRDLPRPALGGCDLGAFELQAAPAAVPPTPAPGTADTTKPKVAVAGVRRACVSRSVTVRVSASDASGIRSTRVTLDGKRIKSGKSRVSVRINVRKLKAGRHTLRIVTTDAAGNTTTTRRTIAKCAAAPKPRRQATPRFTG
jgi:CSLREA domain-containing protein